MDRQNSRRARGQRFYNEDNIRKDLLGLEQQYELGKITIEEFESAESELLQRLQSGAKDEGRTLDHVTAASHRFRKDNCRPVLKSEWIEAETMAGSHRSAAKSRGSGVARVKRYGAAAIAQHAKTELEGITGLDADHVSAVAHQPDGWHVTVDCGRAPAHPGGDRRARGL